MEIIFLFLFFIFYFFFDDDGDESGLTSTEIDDRLSPGNVSLLAGETALLACKIYNLGNKSVR